MNRSTLSALWAACALALAQPALADTLKKPELDKLVAAQQAAPSATFRAFLAQAAKANPSLKASVAAYERKAPLTGDDRQEQRFLATQSWFRVALSHAPYASR